MQHKQKMVAEERAANVPCFGDLQPDLEGVGSVWVSDHLAVMITEMVLSAKAEITDEDLKRNVRNLDSWLGSGIMRPTLLKLVVLVTQLSQLVKDGNNRKKLFEYVTARLLYAAYKHGSFGYDLLDWVVIYVKEDLLDCKAGTVFSRRRAA